MTAPGDAMTAHGDDAQPEHAPARAAPDHRGNPRCGACRRALQHVGQYRCPWLSCRAWLRGTVDEHAADADHERLVGEGGRAVARRRRFAR